MRSISMLLIGALLLTGCSGATSDTAASVNQAGPVRTPVSTVTPTPASTPSPTATIRPTATPSPPPVDRTAAIAHYRALHTHLSRLRDAVARVEASPSKEIPSGAEIVLLPQRWSLWYLQETISPGRALLGTDSQNRVWIVYDYARGEELGMSTMGMPVFMATTKEVILSAQVYLENVNTDSIHSIATGSFTAGKGSSSSADMVSDALAGLHEAMPQLNAADGILDSVIRTALLPPESESWRLLGWDRQRAIISALLEDNDDWVDQRNLILRMRDLLAERPDDSLLEESVAAMLAVDAGGERLDSIRQDALAGLGRAGTQARQRVLAHPDKFVARRASELLFGELYCVDPSEAYYRESLSTHELRPVLKALYCMVSENQSQKGISGLLTELTGHADPTVRALAFAALAVDQPGSDEAALALDALDDPDAWVRAHAASMLGKSGLEDDRLEPALTHIAQLDPDPWARTSAVVALLDLRTAPAVELLVNALEREHGRVLLSLLKVVPNVQHSSSALTPAVATLLALPDTDLSIGAAMVLGSLGPSARGVGSVSIADAWCRQDGAEWTSALYAEALRQITGVTHQHCMAARSVERTWLEANQKGSVDVVVFRFQMDDEGNAFLDAAFDSLQEEYGQQLNIHDYFGSPPGTDGWERLQSMAQQFGVDPNRYPIVFIGHDVLTGPEDIRERLNGLVAEYAAIGGAGYPEPLRP